MEAAIKKETKLRGLALTKKLLESKVATLEEMEVRYTTDAKVRQAIKELKSKNAQKGTPRLV